MSRVFLGFFFAVGSMSIAVILSVLLVIFIIKYLLFRKIKSVSCFSVAFAILAILFYIICNAFVASFGWVLLLDDDKFLYLVNVVSVGCWHYGQLFCYCYLLNRLYIGFKDTEYSLSNKIFILLSMLLFMYFIYCGMIIIDSRMYLNNSNRDLQLIMIEMIGILTFDLILTSSLLIIFIKKLYRVSNRIRVTSITVAAWTDDFDDVKLEVEHLEMNRIYDIISRVTILSVILIITSQLDSIFLIFILTFIIGLDISDHVITGLFAVSDLFRGIHIIIASLCILLGFECMNNWYQYCCNKCHKTTKQYCIKKINQTMNDYNTF